MHYTMGWLARREQEMEVLKSRDQGFIRIASFVMAGVIGLSALTAATSVRAYADEDIFELSGEIDGAKRYNAMVDEDYCETFFTTPEQQAELDRRLSEVLNGLNLWNASEYDKAWGIYQYIAANVHYDYAHLSDSSYMLKYSAYAALCRGTAVCQGYAILYYKMASRLGLDCRMVIGDTSQGRHGWNIVRVGRYYYSIDVTWDSALRDQGMQGYKYFLKGEGNMDDHYLDSEYKSDSFRRLYPISAVDYSPANDAGYREEPAVQEYNNTPVVYPTRFVDITGGQYYTGAVEWAAKNNITNGADSEHFSPENNCTRAEIITFLWRAAGAPKTNYNTGFTDVPEDAFYATAVKWAVRNGVAEGTSNTTFSPDEICTRAQAVTFLYRAAGMNSYKGGYNPFTDVDNGTYYRDAAAWAYCNGIAVGTGDNMFSPDMICNRAQIVTFLYRFDRAVNG